MKFWILATLMLKGSHMTILVKFDQILSQILVKLGQILVKIFSTFIYDLRSSDLQILQGWVIIRESCVYPWGQIMNWFCWDPLTRDEIKAIGKFQKG